nr:zinc finger, BED-type [Tanacetum cinerariifolium]
MKEIRVLLRGEGEEELEKDGSSGVGGEAVGGRELHEDDFLSDEEQVEVGNNWTSTPMKKIYLKKWRILDSLIL